MTDTSSILLQTLTRAKALHLDQKELASLAGVRQETISRAKKRGSLDSRTLDKLISAVGLALSLQACERVSQDALKDKSTSLKDPRWGLSWSNPNINNQTLIQKALTTARFGAILQACLDFGIDDVEKQWDMIAEDSNSQSLVSDILTNIAEGFAHAQT